jgi:hypothetical protein
MTARQFLLLSENDMCRSAQQYFVIGTSAPVRHTEAYRLENISLYAGCLERPLMEHVRFDRHMETAGDRKRRKCDRVPTE